MKISNLFILSAISIAIFACSEKQEADIQPQISLEKGAEKVTSNDRNLRPAGGEKPDLKIFPFFVSGTVTLVSGSYRIPISLKELNVGTANDTGALADSLKVYQKIPSSLFGFYTYRLVQTYVRTAHIPMGSSWFLNAQVNFPAKWRPASGKIHLVIRADAVNNIAELDETNNYSDTIWNIYLP
jgi:hypothetical protein